MYNILWGGGVGRIPASTFFNDDFTFLISNDNEFPHVQYERDI